MSRLDSLVPQLMERTGVPGVAVSVAYRGKTVYAKGFGVRKMGESAPVDADTVFQLASLSKPIGATVMAGQMRGSLVNRQIGWDTPIQTMMPGFELAYPDNLTNSRLTLGNLYSHRSGLRDHTGDQLEEVGYSRDEILKRLRYATLDSYGSYAYTNFGITAAAQAMAQARDTDWATLSEKTLYEPLGMKSTSSRFEDFATRANRAWGHVQIGVDYNSYGASPARYTVQNPPRQPDAQSPAGGVSSSAADMARWMTLVLNKGQWGGQPLISAASLKQAMTAQPGGKYGYGFNAGPDPQQHASVSHSGAFLMGAHTAFVLWPEADLGITVLTNAQPRGLAEAIALTFGEDALGVAVGNSPGTDWLASLQESFRDQYKPEGRQLVGKTPPAPPVPAQPLASYAGRYTNAYYGDVLVEVNKAGSGLRLTMGPAKVDYVLRHWDASLFAFDIESENAPHGSVSAVQFTPGRMAIEYFSQDLSHGIFERAPDKP